MNIIEVYRLEKRFGNIYALRNVSFTLPSGKVAGFLGPNGSGKTTTLKIIIGLLKKDSGKVRVFGLDPWSKEIEVKSRIGVLHERPLYPPNIVVRVLLKHVAKLRGYPLSDVERIARITGIQRYMDSVVGALSRGYIQRLGIALSLIGDPEVLLLDEPTANLDPLARMEILRLINVLKKDLGVTMIVSSHIIPELKEICDYAIFISGGVTVDWGYLEELSSKYGVTSSYKVEVQDARGFATQAISLDYVRGVDVFDGWVIVRVSGRYLSEFRDFVNKVGPRFGVVKITHVGSELGEMYERVIAGRIGEAA